MHTHTESCLLSSNLAFALPAVIATVKNMPLLSVAMCVVAVSSYFYHLNHSCGSARMVDIAVAFITFLFMIVLILCSGSAWLGSAAAATGMIGLALFLDVGHSDSSRDYECPKFCVTHSLWHIMMALTASLGIASTRGLAL